MKASVIREMSLSEIRERIETEKSAYHKMKMNHVVSNLENPIKLKFARKAIARLSTELTLRENAEASGTAPAPTAKAEKTTGAAPDASTEAKPKVEAGEKETVEIEAEAEVVEESDQNEKA